MATSYDLPQIEPILELLNEVSNELDSMHGKDIKDFNSDELRGKIRSAIIILKEETKFYEHSEAKRKRESD